ncbi:MAG TPA: VWA domain-containing protein [Verrucomicrobiae bacterium]|jgi:Ca-activated chloride channel family protein|nr:VWA domain-containing protein [Verrucomicrobiae bacterium]
MDFRHPHFAEPGWLWLALLAPVALVLLQRYAAWARKRQLTLFAAPELLADLLRSHSPARRVVKNIFLVLAIAAMGIALARPQWGETTEISQTLGEDILFVLDCSKSMLATDVAPSRLTRAKYAILDFVQKHGRGRVGLVAFSGQAFLQCPLTFDYDAFREALLAVDEKTIPVPGTDIGRALDEGFRAMEKNERHKVMVLVTDGEDLENSGVNTAKTLAEKGIVVHAIGVGTTAGSPIQVVNDRGLPETLRDRDGAVVVSHLDETTLTAIANATHGSYEPLGSLGEGLNRVRKLVEDSSNTAQSSKMRKLGVDRFYIPVGLLTMLLAVESLIGTRRKLREHGTGE